ncbi:MAG TPA: UPF0149 family protein [Terriglobia bacterium]|jgi:uncharacterized protein|nr:UPF0149 family protein [Terriglobia bacterium]
MDINKPLSESELEDLEGFLGSEHCSDDAMNISALHGYLTALAVGPALVPPSEWLPLVWGKEEPTFDSEEEAQQILTLLMRMYNSVTQELEQGLRKFTPILYEDEISSGDEPYLTAEDWCNGFSLGVGLRSNSWNRLFDDNESMALLVPIIAFSSADAMAGVVEEAQGAADRDLLISMLPISAVALYEYWREDRRKQAKSLTSASEDIRTPPRVGRNDPCICGSGKKYKKCCGKATGEHAN